MLDRIIKDGTIRSWELKLSCQHRKQYPSCLNVDWSLECMGIHASALWYNGPTISKPFFLSFWYALDFSTREGVSYHRRGNLQLEGPNVISRMWKTYINIQF
ncbi:Uncharacterized protein TCM_000184 [Theobroma cacao]|uniref:Uncharacterized protein n=1 Tax=Theobroma cacao TaxID=3641 RepID=A0A061DLH2_THECC|nr:Uncharacterized protein TCM_000184 [Theobroma cacao]